jgi:hypothetical protein
MFSSECAQQFQRDRTVARGVSIHPTQPSKKLNTLMIWSDRPLGESAAKREAISRAHPLFQSQKAECLCLSEQHEANVWNLLFHPVNWLFLISKATKVEIVDGVTILNTCPGNFRQFVCGTHLGGGFKFISKTSILI